MCYSVETSLKTTLLSLFSIIYLLSSGIPHFQWIGRSRINWMVCNAIWGMFAMVDRTQERMYILEQSNHDDFNSIHSMYTTSSSSLGVNYYISLGQI